MPETGTRLGRSWRPPGTPEAFFGSQAGVDQGTLASGGARARGSSRPNSSSRSRYSLTSTTYTRRTSRTTSLEIRQHVRALSGGGEDVRRRGVPRGHAVVGHRGACRSTPSHASSNEHHLVQVEAKGGSFLTDDSCRRAYARPPTRGAPATPYARQPRDFMQAVRSRSRRRESRQAGALDDHEHAERVAARLRREVAVDQRDADERAALDRTVDPMSLVERTRAPRHARRARVGVGFPSEMNCTAGCARARRSWRWHCRRVSIRWLTDETLWPAAGHPLGRKWAMGGGPTPYARQPRDFMQAVRSRSRRRG